MVLEIVGVADGVASALEVASGVTVGVGIS